MTTQIPANMLGNSGNELGTRNRIINGAFNIFQRTTVNTAVALTGSFTYQTADRWALAMAATVAGTSTIINSSLPTGFANGFKIGRNSGSTSTGQIYFNQAIESANSIDLQGQAITVSFWAKAGANFSAASSNMNITVNTGTGGDASNLSATFSGWTGNAVPLATSQPLTTTWIRYSFTCTLASNITNVGIILNYIPTGTAGADDNLYITGVQLEKGATATPFEYRPYGTELALCQRYLPALLSSSTLDSLGMAQAYSTTSCLLLANFLTQARVPATGFTISSASDIGGWKANSTSAGTPTTVTFNRSGVNSAWLDISGWSTAGLVAGSAMGVIWSSASGKLLFTGCEL